MRRIWLLKVVTFTFLASSIGHTFLYTSSTTAVTGADWKAGRIIDDNVFADANDMSVVAIQNFLSTKVPSCDTNGTRPASEYGRPDLTHAQYAAMKGWAAPPYICLRDYYEVPKTSPGPGIPANNYTGTIPAGAISASQMIYDAAQQYRINAKVLLVKLGTESHGPLTSDSWPLQWQYTFAMGAHCPDSGPGGSANCDTNYAGFSIQMREAASLLRWYLDSMTQSWWQYRKPYQVNSILWKQSTTGCGAGDVYIESKATAALYTYTPYQPNQAALNNIYGLGDGCSSYGNRNFWRVYSDWFGDPNYVPQSCDSKAINVTCVWQLAGQNDSNFLTIDSSERDNAVWKMRYSFNGRPFYVLLSNQPGAIPVYRLRLSSEHFYTSDINEKNALLQNSQNTFEGIAFYALPSSETTNSSFPVYRLSGPTGHIFTASSSEKDRFLSLGFSYEGVAFNTPSGLVNTPNSAVGRMHAYRLASGDRHFYTASLAERDSLLRQSWIYENILFDPPTGVTPSPVYRLTKSGDQILTASNAEASELSSAGWILEGVAWYIDESSPQIFRFYVNQKHFYTSDLPEALGVSNRGAKFEAIAFGRSQSTLSPVYRMRNGNNYFYTASLGELIRASNSPWRYEGIAWSSSNSTDYPIFRLFSGTNHFYTASNSEKDQLQSAGWTYEGIGWQSP